MTNNDPFETGTESKVNPKTVAILAYIALIGWIVAVVLNNPKSSLGSFHIRQALGVHALSAAAGIIAIIPILGWIAAIVASIGAIILWIIGIIGAIEGKEKPVPILGEKFQEWFHAM